MALTRRQFLAGGAAAALILPQLARSEGPVSAAAWKSLASSLQGRLVTPGMNSYAVSSQLYDVRFDYLRPAAVAYCASPGDVVRCIRFARQHGLRPIPRGGGHSYGGYSSGSGLVVDVSSMGGVKVKSSAGRAVVGAGTQLVDLYAACGAAGVLVPGGSCPTVGISGLTMGGGIGVVGRRYGLTCDNLISLDLVDAEGRQLHASSETNPDLWWACRGGGGGNFGVVTSFSFLTHPLPQLSHYTLSWDGRYSPTVLDAWQHWMRSAPRDLWSNCQLAAEGTAGLAVVSSGVYCGSVAALESLLQAFTSDAGPTASSFVGSDSYLTTMLVEAGCYGFSVEQCHIGGHSPSGVLSRSSFGAKSAFFSSLLPQAGIKAATSAVVDLHQSQPGAGGALIFDSWGGAINDLAPGASAFVHRDALSSVQIYMSFSPEANRAEIANQSIWLQDAASLLAPFSNGSAYQNYIDPQQPDWLKAYYGSNLARLKAVKRAYDPDDVFHFAQSIPLP